MVIDRTIKRAIFITILVVVVAKATSMVFDVWMDDTQDDMIANQQALSDHLRGRARSQNVAQMQAVLAENCRTMMSAQTCSRPKDFHDAGECLLALGVSRCGELPRVHLCAAVEAIPLCADQFEDQKKNGCDQLRRYASCQDRPAPESRANLWTFKFDDGLWNGND